MRIVSDPTEARNRLTQARAFGSLCGLAPTMGAFHEGHLALFRRARAECGFVAASLFVNPTQFHSPEDYAHYPRDYDRDQELAEAEGVDLLFMPGAEAMYPDGDVTWVEVSGLTEGLCGAHRPG